MHGDPPAWGLALLLALLTLTLFFFAYQNPAWAMNYLPRWLQPSHNDTVDKTAGVPTINVSEDAAKEELSDEEDATPRASPKQPNLDITDIALNEGIKPRNASVAASNGATVPPVPEASSTAQSRTSILMPPPSRSAAVSRNGVNPTASLRMPVTPTLPNSCFSATSQQRVSDERNGKKSGNGRGKVLLAPGHSPMDWAALTRRSGNLSGVSRFERVTPSKLKTMTGRKGKPAWTSWQGKVYNITPYLPFHPGGQPELMRAAGRNATQLFMDVHPWVNFENMLGTCLVGVMVAEEATPLEDMD